MEIFTTELREKPIIGMISGFGAWLINSINTTMFFSDTNPIWEVLSKFGIFMGSMIAVLTFCIKAVEFYDKVIKRK